MSNNKKIALVSNTSWSVYNFRLSLIRHFKASGYDVHVIAPRDRFSAKLVTEGISFHPLYLDNYSTGIFKELRTIQQLYRVYRKYKFDLVIHYTIKPNIYGSFAASWTKIPSICMTTGLGHLLDYKNSAFRYFVNSLYKKAVQKSDKIGFLNEEDLKVFIDLGIADKEKSFLLPGEGVNLNRFSHISESTYISSNKIRFLFAGRILWNKGVGVLVEAAKILLKKHDNIEFNILGFINPNNPNAVPFEQIESWQKDGLIKYLGETDNIYPYLQNASCLLFPSYYREGISRILLEAASAGLPIITTDNVGCRDVVKDGVSGLLCEGNSVPSLVSAIEKFLEMNKSDRYVMGSAARQNVKINFAETKVFEVYDDLLATYFGKNEMYKTKEIEKNKITHN